MEPEARMEPELARAEGEGMNVVAPPSVHLQQRRLAQVRATVQRFFGRLPPRDRVNMVASLVAVGAGYLAQRLRLRRWTMLAMTASAGVAVGMFLKRPAASITQPREENA
jgi:hypothetical protein